VYCLFSCSSLMAATPPLWAPMCGCWDTTPDSSSISARRTAEFARSASGRSYCLKFMLPGEEGEKGQQQQQQSALTKVWNVVYPLTPEASVSVWLSKALRMLASE
jgi:hypothetical protein